MKLILTGATGFAGGEVLRQALADPRIEEVLVLGRRSLALVHPKLRELLLADFLDYSGVDLRGYDACIWCLGVSQTQVDEPTYVKITHGYVLAAAQAMFAANPGLRFCFLSGRGADPSEQGRNLFSRIKGRAERDLFALGREVHSFRPGYIKPTARTGPRKDFARFLAPIGTVMDWVNGAELSVDCDRLARCMLDVASSGSDQPIFSNRAMRQIPLEIEGKQ